MIKLNYILNKKKDPDRGRKQLYHLGLCKTSTLRIKRKTPTGDGNGKIVFIDIPLKAE